MSKWWKGAGVLAVLALMLAPTAVAKVTLDTCGQGEAIWWGHEEGQVNCDPCSLCEPDLVVELGAFGAGDVAAVWLDMAEKIKINEITHLGFRYMHLEYLGAFPSSPVGPALALALEWFDSGEYKQILAISGVAPLQTESCSTFDGGGQWYYGTWDGADLCSYVPVQTTAMTFPALVSTLNGANPAAVKAVGAVMGLPTAPEPYNPTRAIVDDILIRWGSSGSCGGIYDLEPEADDPLSLWPEPVGFDGDPELDGSHRIRDAWTRTGLWQFVESNEFGGEPSVVRDFPSQSWAAYFGNVGVDGKGSYDGAGSRIAGYLTSPCNFFNPGDVYVDLGFSYYRLVEQYKGAYPNQVYDRTWFEYSWIRWSEFEGCPVADPWQTEAGPPSQVGGKVLWYKDSSHPNDLEWTRWDLPSALVIPCDAVGIQIRFGFDSIDGKHNNHLGWLIDDVTKTHSPDPSCVQILTDTLPQATVKVDYEFFLTANKPGIRWEIGPLDPQEYPESLQCRDCEDLPNRLILEPGTGRIHGHPEVGTQGTYRILVRAVLGDMRSPCNYDEKILVLAIRAPEGPMASNTIYAQYFDPANGQTPSAWYGGSGWDVSCALWHLTDTVYYKGTDIVTDQYGTAAYFGKTSNTTSNYATGRQVKCCLTSPWIAIPAESVGEKLILGFKSWREVEYYTKGAYDRTWVEVRFEGEPWKQVWYMDSNDPSLAAWTWEEMDTCLAIPPGKKVQIRFCFDSVDGHNNNYVGWLVDEVALFAGSAALAITTPCPLPDAQVGLPYSVEFTASGGPAGTKVWQMTNVPPGLEFDPVTQILSGIPREEGTFPFTIKVTVLDGSSNPIAEAEKECTLMVGEDILLLFEDFEKDPVWNWGGLWHFTTGVTGVPGLSADNRAAYYGKDDLTPKPNYNTGNRTSGALTLVSPVVNLTGVGAFKVFFDYWREVEPFSGGIFDITVVQVSVDGGAWTPIWQKTSADPSVKQWLKAEIGPILTNGASTMLIRFVFDSVDKWHNNFLGWIIDNIRIERALPNGAQALSAAAIAPAVVNPRGMEIDFFNSPNPVRDVNTTTFAVRGVDAERIKVEIYDLAGRLVYVNEVPGSELVWHTQDVTGLPLANGVYLYKVYVKVGEAWVVSSVQKLTVLR